MRPVGGCPTTTIFGCDRARSMRRGGIHAARQGCAPRRVYGKYGRSPWFVGRAFTPAEPIIFKNFIMCGGVKTPPYKAKQTPRQPGNGQRRTVLRATCMRGPYKPRKTPYKPYSGNHRILLHHKAYFCAAGGRTSLRTKNGREGPLRNLFAGLCQLHQKQKAGAAPCGAAPAVLLLRSHSLITLVRYFSDGPFLTMRSTSYL